MSRTSLIVASLALSAGVAHADEQRWSSIDTAVEGVVLASLAVDYLQTRQIVHDPLRVDHVESNPLIGSGRGNVELYFAGVAVGHALLVYALPPRWRTVAQAATLVVQFHAVGTNYRAGYDVGVVMSW